MAYRRSYDSEPKLSTVVKIMEQMSDSVQRKIADKLLEVSEELLAQLGGNHYLSNLNTEKKEGLKKAQAKKRWYDQYEVLHQAFNNLYVFDNPNRREIAEQMSLPIEIVHGYEGHCKTMHKTPDLKVIEEIVRSCFQEGPARSRKLYSLYLPEFNQEFRVHQKNRLKSEPQKGLWTLLLESLQSAINPT